MSYLPKVPKFWELFGQKIQLSKFMNLTDTWELTDISSKKAKIGVSVNWASYCSLPVGTGQYLRSSSSKVNTISSGSSRLFIRSSKMNFLASKYCYNIIVPFGSWVGTFMYWDKMRTNTTPRAHLGTHPTFGLDTYCKEEH